MFSSGFAYHADEDEPQRAVYTRGYPNIHWKADMVQRRASGVQEDDDATESRSNKGSDNDGLPSKSNGEER